MSMAPTEADKERELAHLREDAASYARIVADLRERVLAGDELLYDAWTLIANGYHGNWDEDPEWKAAAIRWRDNFHARLVASSAVPVPTPEMEES